MMIKNKKGDSLGFVGKAIIMILVLVVSTIIFSNIMHANTTLIQCTKQGGECTSGTCDIFTQIPIMGDKIAGCKEGYICCVNITRSKPVDPECQAKKEGDQCKNSTMYICGPSLQCMTKCDYCALNFGTTVGTEICRHDFNKFQNNKLKNPNKDLTCGCTDVECTQKMRDDGQCILGYCPAKATDKTNPNYMCCVK